MRSNDCGWRCLAGIVHVNRQVIHTLPSQFSVASSLASMGCDKSWDKVSQFLSHDFWHVKCTSWFITRSNKCRGNFFFLAVCLVWTKYELYGMKVWLPPCLKQHPIPTNSLFTNTPYWWENWEITDATISNDLGKIIIWRLLTIHQNGQRPAQCDLIEILKCLEVPFITTAAGDEPYPLFLR